MNTAFRTSYGLQLVQREGTIAQQNFDRVKSGNSDKLKVQELSGPVQTVWHCQN